MSAAAKEKIKDKPKCKEWERRRREKLNDAFKILSQLLPNYDPAKSLAKIDILERSSDFVKELRLSNSRLVSYQSESDEKCKLIQELQDEVNKLILRVKQLTTLLKAANIQIPSGPCIQSLGQRNLKWSGKIVNNAPENLESTKKQDEVDKSKNQQPESPNENICGESNHVLAKAKDASKDISTPTTVATPLKEINSLTTLPTLVLTTSVPCSDDANPNPLTKELEVISAKEHGSFQNCSSKPKSPSKKSNKKSPAKQASISAQDIGALSVTSTNINSTTATAIPLVTSAPVTGIFKEPPKSTTATMLPMQTIILTSCPMGSTVLNGPTRIALGPTRLLSNGFDGYSSILQKIPILPLRKPIPKIKRTRKKRKKNLVVEVSIPISNEDTLKMIPASKSTENVIREPEPTLPIPVENSGESNLPIDSEIINPISEVNEDEGKINEKVEKQVEITAEKDSEINITNLSADPAPEPICKDIDENDKVKELMQIQLYADDPDQEIMEVDSSTKEMNSSHSVFSEKIAATTQANEDKNNTNIILENISNEIIVPSSSVVICKNQDVEPEATKTIVITAKQSSFSQVEQCVSYVKLTNKNQWEPIQADELSKSAFDQNMELDDIPTPNPDTNSPKSETTTGDKISECIARSIDLIDAPDGELMELGDTTNWGDTTNSPKSVSPTQMFLNMFPLLPKETPVTEGNLILAQTSMPNPNSRHSAHSYKSFFIDSMLPEDNSGGTNMQLKDHQRTAVLELTSTSHSEKISSTESHRSFELIAFSSSETTEESTNSIATSTGKTKHSTLSPTKSKPATKEKSLVSIKQSSSKYYDENQKQTQIPSILNNQQTFKDLNLFSDSMEFNFQPVPFTQFSDHDLLKDGSRNRGLLDSSLPFNMDVNPQHPIAEQMHNMEIPENFQTSQPRDHSEREQLIRLDERVFNKTSQNHAFSKSSTIKASLASNNLLTPTIINKSQSIQPSLDLTQMQTNSHNSLKQPHHGKRSLESSLNLNSSPSKIVPPKRSPAIGRVKHLFRPQVNDFLQVQNATSGLNSSYFPSSSAQNLQDSGNSSTQNITLNVSNFPNSNPHLLSQKPSKNCSPIISEGNKIYSNYIPPASSFTTASESPYNPTNFARTPPEKKQTSKKSVRAAKDTGLGSQSSSSTIVKNRKDNAKESLSKKTSSSSSGKGNKTSEFNNDNNVPNLNFPPSIPRTSSTIHTSNTSTQPNIFSHQHMQNFDHNLNVNIFPELALSLESNFHYDHYNMDFSYNAQSESSSQTHFHHQTQTQVLPSTQHQSQPTNRNSRPTPFYLQDVNCDNFDFQNHGQNQNAATHQNNPFSHQVNQAQGISSTTTQAQYNQNPIHKHHQPYSVATNSNNSSGANSNHYYHSSQPPSLTPQHCQHNYPAQEQSSSSTQSSSSNRDPLINQNQHQVNRGPLEQTMQPHPHYGSNLQQPQIKSKQVSSTVSSLPHNSQAHLTQSQQPAFSHNNSRVPSQSISTSSSSSHRPVNWMTDSNNLASTPSQTTFSISNSPKSNNNPTTNLFSVSKLVGSNSTNLNIATSVPQVPQELNRQNNSSTNYCAEALIRKNPTSSSNQIHIDQNSWILSNQSKNQGNPNNNIFFQPSGGSTSHSHQPSFPNTHHPNSNHILSSSANSNFNDDNNLSGSYQYHHNHNQQLNHGFGTFESVHTDNAHQQFNFQPHANIHQNQLQTQNQGSGTSSVSNFNLSTIFPEINDKRQAQQNSSRIVANNNANNNSAVRNSGSSSSSGANNRNINSSNNCAYYPSQQNSSGQGRNK